MNPSLRSLGLLAGLALGLAARADTTLAPTSPFAPPEGSASVATENQALELRGILMDDRGYRFSVYDPARKSGEWVRINEPGHNFTVKSHDAAHDSVTLDYQGRTLTLALHTAKVVGVMAPPPEIVRRQTIIGSEVSGNLMQPAKPGSPEETARFNRAVEEINRRRALRERPPATAPQTPK